MVHLSQAQYIKTTLKEYQHYITKYNIGEYDSPKNNCTPYGKYQCPVPNSQEAQEMKTYLIESYLAPYYELLMALDLILPMQLVHWQNLQAIQVLFIGRLF